MVAIQLSSSESLRKKATRNAQGLTDKQGSQASAGKESVVSLPDERKIKEDLHRLAESEDEDAEFVQKIEQAHVTRLNVEKDDN